MHILRATEERARGARLDDAEHELAMGVRREALSRVPGSQDLERLDDAHARHGRRFGRSQSRGHRSRGEKR